MAYKFFILIVLVILAVLFLSSIIEYIPATENEPARLSLVWESKPKCVGELTISSISVNGKCDLTANVVLKNCEEKRWSVFSGKSCSETPVCDGDVEVSPSRWECAWEADEGSYTFVLCVDGNVKARYNLIC